MARSNWLDVQQLLAEAFVNAFNEPSFGRLVTQSCGRRFDKITIRYTSFPDKVDEVLAEAARGGWLEQLIAAAAELRPEHQQLAAAIDAFEDGVAADSSLFYQQPYIDREAGIEEERVLIRQLQPYLEMLQRQTMNVPLVALDEAGRQGGRVRLSQLYVPLNLGHMANGRLNRNRGSDEALRYISQRNQLIVLGDPGSGKSTLVNYYTFRLAALALGQQTDVSVWPTRSKDPAPIPVLITMRDFARQPFDPADPTAIVNYIVNYLNEQAIETCTKAIRQLALRGRLLFLLDGVDEVPADERPQIWKVIEALEQGVYGGNRPIVGVSWYEANAYCAWLSEVAGRTYRLLTELEWERAARHTDGREFAWGNEWQNDIANTKEANVGQTTTVGAFPRAAAECGAHDLTGNVREWTLTFYDKDEDAYFLCGGSWGDNQYYVRVAYRSWHFPSGSWKHYGFRVVSPVF